MLSPWFYRRENALFVFVALLGSSVSGAQEPGVKEAGPQPEEVRALEITQKQFNEETGALRVVLRNQSDLAVTAFGLSYVDASPTGSKGTHSEDLYIQGGIAPGDSYEIEIQIREPGESSTSNFPARSVKLDHEIRSDNTSYGNTKHIGWFEHRVAHFDS